MIDLVKFASEILEIFAKKTNGYRISPLKTHQNQLFSHIRELLFMILYSSYSCTEYESLKYFAHKSLNDLIQIIENIKLFMSYTKNET